MNCLYFRLFLSAYLAKTHLYVWLPHTQQKYSHHYDLQLVSKTNFVVLK